LYEALITDALQAQLAEAGEAYHVERAVLDAAEAPDRYALHLARVIERALRGLDPKTRVQVGADLLRQLVDRIAAQTGQAEHLHHAPIASGELLRSITGRMPDGSPASLDVPLTSLLDTTLLTNAPGEPRIGSQVLAEIPSADRIDLVMAFIRISGIVPLLDALQRHRLAGRSLRILTTTYTGSTQVEALDALHAIGADIRVSYDETSTRLHAKAWLFQRDSGYSTAYIGSSNLTHSAQVSGLEWNVRIANARNSTVVDKVSAVFESYWNSGDFVPYCRDEFLRRIEPQQATFDLQLSPVELRPEPFQARLLEQLHLARRRGHHKNLLVSATGTGKTVMAALDYAWLSSELPRARLLFIAHREEILKQSLATFRHAMRRHDFGELWVGGERPQRFEHVFASIQSLARIANSDRGLNTLDPHHFDVVIVDEFHHAAAHSYRALLEHVQPVELLGLTATPERADGLSVLDYFDGRIAAELRLWDAIDHQRLVPFSYYGVHDGLDLTRIPWKRGRGYDVDGLTNIYTANDAWSNFVVQELQRRVPQLRTMRALGFCVSVEHARYMARVFQAVGIPSVAIWADTPSDERRQALIDLDSRTVNVVFSVDLFNEGVDVPSVDTLLMLRPTDSGTLFLQQLGRGLRRCHGKTHCTVLDFVGLHRTEFRFEQRLGALLGGTRPELVRQIEQGFPYLPAGCHMELDRIAARIVLDNIRSAIPSRWPEKVAALQGYARSAAQFSLAGFLAETGLELDDIYNGSKCWSDLLDAAGFRTAPRGEFEVQLRRACSRMLHIDDDERIALYRSWLRAPTPPVIAEQDERERRYLRMLVASMTDQVLDKATTLEEGAAWLWAHAQVRAELLELLTVLDERVNHLGAPLAAHPDVPLRLHARYTRIEIQAAFGLGAAAKTPLWQSGVLYAKEARADLLAFTKRKVLGRFSPSTMYEDYAISRDLIHWQSQSTTSSTSPTGKRYQQHATSGSSVMLFARESVADRAFYFLGPATYVQHTGSEPMSITWRLEQPLPGDLTGVLAVA
jgi:superfamily II DNA or RNA helicase/HKD family nuclease